MFDKVVNEKLINKATVGGVDFSLNDKGTASIKSKIGGLDVSANSDGHAQATGKIAGGTMSTAVNKDGDGGSAYNRGGKTVSQTSGSNDAWVSQGPNQISKRISLNNSKVQEDDHEMSDDEYQRILMRKSTSKALGSTPPTYDKKKFDNYSKANKRGAYSNAKVRQSVDFDEDLDEATYTSKTTRAQGVSPDYGFYTTAKGDKFALMFNDGNEDVLLGTYDSHTELQQAKEYAKKEMRKGYRKHGVDMQKPMGYDIAQDDNGQYVATVNDSHFGEYVVGTYKTEKEAKWAIDFHNKSHDEEERMDTTGHELEEATDDIDYKDSDLWQANNSERTDDYTDKVEWEIVINGNTYTTSNGATEDEAINNFWKAVVEKEGIKKFLGDMVYAQELTSSTDLDEDLNEMLKIAGLR
jgi:hypothetical protein